MDIGDLFKRLSYGELSNLSIGGEGSGEISTDSKAKIIEYANEGLTRLFSRFVLKEKVLTLIQERHITKYLLSNKHAVTNTTGPITDIRYIHDHEHDPFNDDLLRILAVYAADGSPYRLNDSHDCFSLFSPQFNILEIPNPNHGYPVFISYQAKHDDLNHLNEQMLINIPFVLEGALISYIAHKVFFHMNGQDNATKAAGHYSNYEAICFEVLDKDLVSNSISVSNLKFKFNGWS